MDKRVLVVGVVLLLLLAGCTGTDTALDQDGQNRQQTPEWMQKTLNDVSTGEAFSIGQFDKPVLLESFAVWCPTCTTQQKEIKKMHEDVGDSIISISINIDSQEDQEKIQSHIDKHDFDWYYAVAPTDLTRSLKDEFGSSILVAPRAPMVLVCPNGDFKRLADGVKTAQTLKEEVDKGC